MQPQSSPIGSKAIQAPRGRGEVAEKKKDKGKKRALGWGMGPEGWAIEERFKRFGEHCARNQVSNLYTRYYVVADKSVDQDFTD